MIFALGVMPADAKDQLYLLAGTASNTPIRFPVRLYRVDTSTGAVVLEKDVASGMSCVITDYVGRRLVIASPALMSNEFSFIDMNSPGSIVTRHLAPWAGGVLPGQMYLLDLPNIGPGIAFTVEKLDINANRIEYSSALTFVSPKSSDDPVPVPFDSLKNLRVGGEVGGALYMVKSRVILRGDPLQVAVGKADKGMRPVNPTGE